MKSNGNLNGRTHGLIYSRLSDRDIDDPSTERQINMVLAEFKRRGIVCHPDSDIFCEGLGHHSGRFTGNRYAYQKFIDAIETRGDVGFVGFTGQDRAFRSVDEFRRVVAILKRKQVEVVTTHEKVDLESAAGLMMATIVAAVNEYYPNKGAEDQRKNIAFWVQSGGKWGKMPQGLKPEGKREARHYVASDETYAAPDGQQRTYLQTVEAFFRIYTTQDVGGLTAARLLNADGYKWRTNKGKPVQVNPRMLWQTLRYHNQYRGILPDGLLDRVGTIFARRSNHRLNGRARRSPPPLLWRLLTCPTCGRTYHTAFQEGYYIYRHRDGQCPDEQGVYARKIDAQVIEYLRKHLKIAEAHKKEILRRLRDPQKSVVVVHGARRRAQLDREKINLARHLAQERITPEQYARAMAQVDAELAALPPDQLPAASSNLTPELVDHYLDGLGLLVEHLAGIDPADANLLLRDLFQRIEILGKKITRFVPYPSTKILFVRWK